MSTFCPTFEMSTKRNTSKTQVMRKFESVKEGDVVRFMSEKLQDSGVVVKVTNNTFTVKNFSYYEHDGVKKPYTRFYAFYKTGTKSNHRYTYGNAIDIIGSIN